MVEERCVRPSVAGRLAGWLADKSITRLLHTLISSFPTMSEKKTPKKTGANHFA